VLVSDGGVFERDQPRSNLALGRWRSINGNIGAMEFLTAHWDAKGARWVGGAQDNDVQVAPEHCTSQSTALGINFGDGTMTAVDNSVTPTRLYGTTQFYGQRDDDSVAAERGSAGVGYSGEGDDDAKGDDDDDPNDAMTTSPQGMLMWSKVDAVCTVLHCTHPSITPPPPLHHRIRLLGTRPHWPSH
jgi:hypothetical protein